MIRPSCRSRSNREKCPDSRSWSRVLAIACYPFTSFETANSRFEWIYFFKPTPDSCFVLLGTHGGNSSVLSSISWYVLLQYALLGKTVLERFKFRYFCGPSNNHQARLAIAGNADGRSAFRVGLWSLSVFCPLLWTRRIHCTCWKSCRPCWSLLAPTTGFADSRKPCEMWCQ